MGILFSQSDHTYCRIPAWDFKYQGRQNFVKQMDIKQANISESYTGVRTSVCGSACIHVVPPDPKVHKLATRSTCMDGGRISSKLVIPKSICLSTFYSYRESASQSSEGQAYIDHSNTNVSFPTMVQLLRMSIQDSIFIPPFPNLLTDPNQNQHPLCQIQISALAAWKVSGNSILQKAYQTR